MLKIQSINAVINLAWRVAGQNLMDQLDLENTHLKIDWESKKVYLFDGTTQVEIPDYETVLLQVRYEGDEEDYFFG